MRKIVISLFMFLLMPCAMLVTGCDKPNYEKPTDGDQSGGTKITVEAPPTFTYETLDLSEQERIYNIYVNLTKSYLQTLPSMSFVRSINVVAKSDLANAPNDLNSQKSLTSATYYDKENHQYFTYNENGNHASGVVNRNGNYYAASYDFDNGIATNYIKNFLADSHYADNQMYEGLLSSLSLGVTYDKGFLSYSEAIDKEQALWYEYSDDFMTESTKFKVVFTDLKNETYSVTTTLYTEIKQLNSHTDLGVFDTTIIYYDTFTYVFNESKVLSSNALSIRYNTNKFSESKEYSHSESITTTTSTEIKHSVTESNFEKFDIYHNEVPFALAKYNVTVYLDGRHVYLQEQSVGTTVNEIRQELVKNYGAIQFTAYSDIQHYTTYPLDVIKSWEDTTLYMETALTAEMERIRVVKSTIDEFGYATSTAESFEDLISAPFIIEVASENNIFDKLLINQQEVAIVGKKPQTIYFNNTCQTVELIDYQYEDDFIVKFKGEELSFTGHNLDFATFKTSKTLTLADYTEYFYNFKYYKDLYFDASYVDIEFYTDKEHTNKLEQNYAINCESEIYVKFSLKENVSILAYKNLDAKVVYSYVLKSQPLTYSVSYNHEIYLYTFASVKHSDKVSEITYSRAYGEGEVSIDISTLDDIIYVTYRQSNNEFFNP